MTETLFSRTLSSPRQFPVHSHHPRQGVGQPSDGNNSIARTRSPPPGAFSVARAIQKIFFYLYLYKITHLTLISPSPSLPAASICQIKFTSHHVITLQVFMRPQSNTPAVSRRFEPMMIITPVLKPKLCTRAFSESYFLQCDLERSWPVTNTWLIYRKPIFSDRFSSVLEWTKVFSTSFFLNL
jgi:hypothetical protein